MAVMGLRLAARSNGVARCTAPSAGAMFQGLWPDLTVDEVPIGSITNGVHGRTWASARVDALLHAASSARTGPAPTPTRWAPRPRRSTRSRRGRRSTTAATSSSAWPASASARTCSTRRVLTVGFARRFATYKRATLLLSDADRLGALLHDAERPVQFVFAGKAHPADTPGKELIQRDRAVRPPRRRAPPLRVPRRLRHLDRPGDVPRLRRVAEHAAPPARGVRHERHEGGPQRRPQLQHPRRLVGRVLRRRQRVGHRVGRRRPRPGAPRPARGRQPVRHPREPGRAPLLRPRPRRRARAQWVEMVLAGVGVARPAGHRGADGPRLHDGPLRAGRGVVDPPRRRTAPRRPSSWRRGAGASTAAWDDVAVTSVDVDDTAAAGRGHPRRDGDASTLGGLTPADVRVEVVHGPLGHDGEFRATSTIAELQPAGAGATPARSRSASPAPTACSARVIPVHPDLASPFDVGRIAWAT